VRHKVSMAFVAILGLSITMLSGDRGSLQAAAPVACLACTGPQCFCDPEPFLNCDGATNKNCKCNAE